MKSLTCAFVLTLGTGFAAAAVVNDGTAATGLIRRAPEPLLGSANTTLVTNGLGSLNAIIDEPSSFNFPALHTLWFSEGYAATGAVFKVSASVTLDSGLTDDSGVGIVGWFDESTGMGISFSLKTNSATYAGVEVYNFDTGSRPRGALYDTNGIEVHPDFSLAWKALVGPGYRATNAAVLELSFESASTNDLEVLPAATAHLRARALQNNGQGLQEISPSLEFLTTLPEPTSGESRFGYYAVYSPIAARTGPIGKVDELGVEGQFGRGNQRPTVSLSSPSAGAIFAPGAAVDLVADAADPDVDGAIVQVAFFVNNEPVGSATSAPFSAAWSTNAVGTYTITAVATDDRGATQVSEAVEISVADIITEPPVLTITRNADSITVSWDRAGFQLQSSTDLRQGWTDVATSGTQHTEPISSGLKLFRLVGNGVPAGPSLSLTFSGGVVSVAWSQTGYQLQSAGEIDGQWTTITTQGTQFSEPIAGARKFYRLTR